MAKKKKTTNKSNHATRNVGIGVGITAAAAAAAGAYFLYGSKNAKANRAKVKSWMLKAKGEVLEALEYAEEMSKEEYEELIEKIAATYATVQSATKKDIADFKREMKDHWKKIEKEAKPAAKKVAKQAKKTAKKVAKKAKKTAKKASK